ncbi:MAG: penicillin-binding protein [Candidatus Methylomirabilia bacterium]
MRQTSISPLRSRVLIVTALVASAFLGVVFRLVVLQVIMHEESARLAEKQYSRTIALRPKRGPIVDRTGRPLAVSIAAESLYAHPDRIAARDQVARSLAPLLGEPQGEIAKRLETDRPFVWVKRKVPPSVARSVRAMREPGLGLIQEPLRLYPNRELAAHVLGFVGVDAQGLEGVEGAWDHHLAGQPGLAVVERDALGREVNGALSVLMPAAPGQGLSLTLDATIQYLAEREIDRAWRRTEAKVAMAVVLDPRTGELLALAIRPTFNPNNFTTASAAEWRNRVVTDPFEPGSIFKIILAAAALEEGVVKPEDLIYGEEGAITVANTVIHDWKQYGWLTFSEILQHSSNVGAIKVGLALGEERYFDYISRIGFGSLTGLGLPGESRGQVRSPEQWSGLSLAALSIGQEISVTPLQMVTAVAAVANGGRLLQPQLVRALLDASGSPLGVFQPRVIRQVISPATARTLTGILTRAVREGTGRRAAIEGYEVAGKTGSAQKFDLVTNRYSRKPGVLSFVGFAPAEDPRIAMLVLLDEPRNAQWAGEAAAPVFAAVARAALKHLNVQPRDTPPVQVVRGLRPGSVVPVSGRATGLGLRWVPAEVKVPERGGAPPRDFAPDMPTMPDLMGEPLRPALAALSAYDVNVEIHGGGVVVAQKPAPGAVIERGMTCRLELAPPAWRQ